MNYKNVFTGLMFIGISTFIAACNQASFNATPGGVRPQCVDGRPEVQCQISCDDSGTCFQDYDYNIQAQAQVTDALFVVDNSASMHNEQASMAQRFPSFMQSIQHIDYRIGMITTDVTITPGNNPAPYNGNGAWQDGRLVEFANGRPFLDGSDSVQVEQQLFQNNVQRQETLECARRGFEPRFCPSGDERGIFASVLNIENNPHNWIRSTGHMAIVILSDEDEGSDGIFVSEAFGVNEHRDRPQNFVQFFRQRFPNKSLAVHSIIIRPGGNGLPADTHCFNRQAQSPPRGAYGSVYAQLTDLTDGVLGNVCSSNFTNQLQEIGEAAAQFREVLPCQPFQNQVEVSFIPEPPGQVNVIRRLEQREILFEGEIPAGTQINLRFRCQQ
jgi:hypothetical protein